MYSEMAHHLGHEEDLDKFEQILAKGKRSFEEKLWNGEVAWSGLDVLLNENDCHFVFTCHYNTL